MQSKTKPAKKKYVPGEWYRWFAWRPVKVYLVSDVVPSTHYAPWRRVWLEYVEYKELDAVDRCRLMDTGQSYLIRRSWWNFNCRIRLIQAENGQKEEGAETPSQGGE